MPRKKKHYNHELFNTGSDLPLFSGIAQEAPKQPQVKEAEQPQVKEAEAEQLTTDMLPQIEITYTKG